MFLFNQLVNGVLLSAVAFFQREFSCRSPLPPSACRCCIFQDYQDKHCLTLKSKQSTRIANSTPTGRDLHVRPRVSGHRSPADGNRPDPIPLSPLDHARVRIFHGRPQRGDVPSDRNPGGARLRIPHRRMAFRFGPIASHFNPGIRSRLHQQGVGSRPRRRSGSWTRDRLLRSFLTPALVLGKKEETMWKSGIWFAITSQLWKISQRLRTREGDQLAVDSIVLPLRRKKSFP